MYDKQAAARLREQFWVALGKYMKPVYSAEGAPVNWINYKTGVKHILFRMDATQQEAYIAIELVHTDAAERALCWEQFVALQSLFTNTAGTDWDWQPSVADEYGVPKSRILATIKSNVYEPDNWPALISFLKPRLIALDQFWTDAKYAFGAG